MVTLGHNKMGIIVFSCLTECYQHTFTNVYVHKDYRTVSETFLSHSPKQTLTLPVPGMRCTGTWARESNGYLLFWQLIVGTSFYSVLFNCL